MGQGAASLQRVLTGSLAARLGGWASALAGPVGLPVLCAGILWTMLRSPGPVVHLFPLFHSVVLALFLGAGFMWAFLGALAATGAGVMGFLFADAALDRFLFAAHGAFLWGLVWALYGFHARRQGTVNRGREELDRLDLDATRLAADVQRMEGELEDGREQLAAYQRLQRFTDDLIGTYHREELAGRAKRGLEGMFPRVEAEVRFFPEPDRPAPGDEWGRKVMEWARPRLLHSQERAGSAWTPGRSIYIPLRAGDNTVGWLGLDTRSDQRLFQVADLRMAAIAADLVCLALSNADRYAQTESLAISDGLTGVYTRGYFDERLREEFAKARHRSEPLSVVLADIDFFKKINDVHGHHRGDEVLRWLARSIAAQARQTDLVARYGGEEFVVLMPNARGGDTVRFAERLCRAVSSGPFRWENKRIQLTISLGVSTMESGVSSPTELLRRADEALYRAKRGGRNRVCAYE